jgi:hypothetical protein
MYLVVGATGPVGLGGEICRLLRSAAKPTRALVRATSNAGRVGTLRKLGVELFVYIPISGHIDREFPFGSARPAVRR